MTAGDEGVGVETCQNPDHEAARDLIHSATAADALVTIVGRCTVDYAGRAASTLGPGERLVVLKPDGTALVHTDEGYQPVSWHSPGGTHDADVIDDRLRVESHRESAGERLLVEFETLLDVSAYGLTDDRNPSVDGTEADLRDRVLNDPESIESGFTPLATERQTPAGAVDIFGEDAVGRAVVVELKRRRAGPEAVGQLGRYVEATRRDLHANRTVRGILVAPSVTDRARRLLAERGLEFVALTPVGTESG